MINLVNHHNHQVHAEILAAMHADRKRVFVDFLKWNVPHENGLERDEFDDVDAVYLIAQCPERGAHLASLRLLRTDRKHILGDLFPDLCDQAPPRGPDTREITRFCLAPGIGKVRRLAARSLLGRSLVEYALLTGIRSYTGVAELAWLSQILSAGWDVRPLGLPREVGGKMLGAVEIRITGSTLKALAPVLQFEGRALRTMAFELPLAA